MLNFLLQKFVLNCKLSEISSLSLSWGGLLNDFGMIEKLQYARVCKRTFSWKSWTCGPCQPQNGSFCEKLKSVQYKGTLPITEAIQGTSREKIYQELGLESLKSRRWYKCLSSRFKIIKDEHQILRIKLTLRSKQTIRTRNNRIPSYNCRADSILFSLCALNDLFNFRWQHKKLRIDFNNQK